jgi:hypothetical protein
MSKVDAQRAMREAKYARVRASGPTRREAAAREQPPTAGPPSTPTAGPPSAPAAAVPEAAPILAASSAEGCGHKSMNGRTCTRPAGHAEKSHRYS